MLKKSDQISSETLNKLGDEYFTNPVIRGIIGLIQLAPPVSAFDEAANASWQRAKERKQKADEKRKRTLLKELYEGRQELTEELIQQEDFLFAIEAVARASLRARRDEKIHLFARLLLNACQDDNLGSDAFDEYLNILDSLTIRELKVLKLFKIHQENFTADYLNNPQVDKQPYWEAFSKEAEKQLNIPKEHLTSILASTSRTGLFELYPVGSLSGRGVFGSGQTTPRFEDFKKWIREKSSE